MFFGKTKTPTPGSTELELIFEVSLPCPSSFLSFPKLTFSLSQFRFTRRCCRTSSEFFARSQTHELSGFIDQEYCMRLHLGVVVGSCSDSKERRVEIEAERIELITPLLSFKLGLNHGPRSLANLVHLRKKPLGGSRSSGV